MLPRLAARVRASLTLVLLVVVIISLVLLDNDAHVRKASYMLGLDGPYRHLLNGLRLLLAPARTAHRPGAWEPSIDHVTLAVLAFTSPSIEERCQISAHECDRAHHDQQRSSLRNDDDWIWLLERLVRHVRWPMVVATSPTLAPRVRTLRAERLLVLEYDDATAMPPLTKLGGWTWAEQQADFVQQGRGWSAWPGVYAAWAAKAWLVAEAARLNPFGSRLFFWLDAGALNERHPAMLLHPLPDLALLGTRAEAILASGRSDELIVSATSHPNHAEGLDQPRSGWPHFWIQGLLFGGSASAVTRYADLYERTLDLAEHKHWTTAAREEALMTWLARQHPFNVLLAASASGCPSFYHSQLYSLLYTFSDPACMLPLHNGVE